ncbi:hypothetical protein VTN49DRAFT_120 [Thermomyces lanuginosus]|uniref:uncharacterized protein n=1 Tax=Thermomyces lanuginosus TaxID=5541 RepID=UPI0037442735
MSTSSEYATELEIACLTVQRAARVTKSIIAAIEKDDALDKSDNTPVTIADFAAQALIISALHAAFPDDGFIGEETAAVLRQDAQLRDRVWDLVRSAHLDDPDSDSRLAKPDTVEEMLSLIDLGGNGQGGSEGRIWVLDPVDGTSTFMKGQQYVVSLALLENGEQKLGVLGCPNLRLDTPTRGRVRENVVDRDGLGQMIFAVAGQGAYIRPLGPGGLEPASRLPRRDDSELRPSDIRLVDCQASNSTDYEKLSRVAARLGAPWPPVMDIWSSQMRYVALAVDYEVNSQVRIVRRQSHRSSIWDHAGGMLVANEIGCKVTDLHGNAVHCDRGRTLAGSCGIIAAPESVHGDILRVVSEVLAESPSL